MAEGGTEYPCSSATLEDVFTAMVQSPSLAVASKQDKARESSKANLSDEINGTLP